MPTPAAFFWIEISPAPGEVTVIPATAAARSAAPPGKKAVTIAAVLVTPGAVKVTSVPSILMVMVSVAAIGPATVTISSCWVAT